MPGCLGHGSKSGEAGRLLGVHGAKLRHFDQEHGGGQFTDARNADQDRSPFGQFGVLGYPFGDIGFDGGDTGLDLGILRLIILATRGSVASFCRFRAAVRSLMSARRAIINSLS